jgi:predicted O-methyltransferase YrrM
MRRRLPLRALRARAFPHVQRLGVRLAPRLGLDAIPHHYHSVVTRFEDVPEDVWTRRSPLEGIEFDTAAQLAWAQRELEPFLAEFPAREPQGWTASNNWYDRGDADFLYAMVRRLRPRRIVEVGSGFSSMVIDAACAMNARDGARPDYQAYDPYPRVDAVGRLEHLTRLHTLRAQEIPMDVLESLEAGDVLFIDTSHTLKPGGDVNRLVLDVLPRLAVGVVVHFHDILLPGEYHSWWYQMGLQWNEAYLVQAFLCLNRHFAVRVSLAGLWLEQRQGLQSLVPGLGAHRPSALWIERIAA